MADTLPEGATGLLVLADGVVIPGLGVGAVGSAVGEVCFNTAMTGYQEILTDPSYMAQIVTFTFPHIGNVGVNLEDVEQFGREAGLAGAGAGFGGSRTTARGAIFRDAPTDPANWRSTGSLSDWLARRGVVGLSGVDTRALTARIREQGMPHAVIAHAPDGRFDLDALRAQAQGWAGLTGLDLAREATTLQSFTFDEGLWAWPGGYAGPRETPRFEVAVMDYGIKRNILRALTSIGARATVLPASTTAEEVLARAPDGVLLSNGPGDPAATGDYAVPEIRKLMDSGVPMFGICLGHQMLARALGAETSKMDQGPPRGEPPGEGPRHRARGDRLHEPRLHGGPRDPARSGARDACEPVRRHQRRHRAEGPPRLQRAAPPGGQPRPDRQPLPVRALRGADGARERLTASSLAPDPRSGCRSGPCASSFRFSPSQPSWPRPARRRPRLRAPPRRPSAPSCRRSC